MTHRLLFFFLMSVPVICLGQSEPTNPILKNGLGFAIDEYFNAHRVAKTFNGCILVRKDGELLIGKAYNMEEDSLSSLFVHLDSQFDLHSVSKLMAQAMIVDLESEGILSRTDFLDTHIPGFPNGNRITIQQLMDNQSGLPRELHDTNSPFEEWTTQTYLAEIAKEPLEFEPGTDRRYSNLGYQLLYYIIGKKRGLDFDRYTADEVFFPLEMNHSGAHPHTDDVNLTNYATNHEQVGNEIEIVSHYGEDIKPQALLYSCVKDLDKYLLHLSSPIYEDALASDNGIMAWAGGSEGIRSYIHRNVQKDYHFAILANYDGIPLETIIHDLEAILEGREYKVPEQISRTSSKVYPSNLSHYVGFYDFIEAGHLILEIREESDSLALYQDNERLQTLLAENDSVFFPDPHISDSFTFHQGHFDCDVTLLWKGMRIKGIRKESFNTD